QCVTAQGVGERCAENVLDRSDGAEAGGVGPEVDRQPSGGIAEVRGVDPRVADDPRGGAGDQRVVAPTAVQLVRAGPTEESVVAGLGALDDRIAEEDVVAALAPHDVVPRTAVEHVVTGAALE